MGALNAYSRQNTPVKIAVWVVGVFLGLTVLGSFVPDDTSTTASKTESTTKPKTQQQTQQPAKVVKTAKPKAKKAAKKFNKKTYAAKLEKTFKANLGGEDIGSMCDAAFTHWSCFYDGIEVTSQHQIEIKLTTDGGWSESDLDEMGKRARLHWFNFVGTDYSKLDTIVSFINGLDTGTTYRRDVPLLNR